MLGCKDGFDVSINQLQFSIVCTSMFGSFQLSGFVQFVLASGFSAHTTSDQSDDGQTRDENGRWATSLPSQIQTRWFLRLASWQLTATRIIRQLLRTLTFRLRARRCRILSNALTAGARHMGANGQVHCRPCGWPSVEPGNRSGSCVARGTYLPRRRGLQAPRVVQRVRNGDEAMHPSGVVVSTSTELSLVCGPSPIPHFKAMTEGGLQTSRTEGGPRFDVR